MVINQAHLGCNKSVFLFLDTSLWVRFARIWRALNADRGISLAWALSHAVVLFIHENHFLLWISMYLESNCPWSSLLWYYSLFQGLFWLSARVLLSADQQNGTTDSVVTNTVWTEKNSSMSHLVCCITE